jgi:hypothetical protein
VSGGRIGDLEGIWVISGTALDSTPEGDVFRGFVTVRATAVSGDVLVGQLDPDEVRAMAMRFLEVAEAADQDRIVFAMLTRDIGLPRDVAAVFIRAMRQERDGGDEPEEGDGHG